MADDTDPIDRGYGIKVIGQAQQQEGDRVVERTETCGNCRYYDTYNMGDDAGYGECHRNAPTVPGAMLYAACLAMTRQDEEAVEITDSGFAFWPDVRHYEWCGEWKGKDRFSGLQGKTPRRMEG